jgi:uncharacterized protein (TIGR02246 family)
MTIANLPTTGVTAAVAPDARAAVDALNARFARAIGAGDAAAVASVYATDATLLAPDVEAIRGRDAIRAYWAAGLASGISGVDLDTVRLEAIHEGVLEQGTFVLRLGTAHDAKHLTGKYVVVHRRQPDGSWAWETDIFNANGAPA